MSDQVTSAVPFYNANNSTAEAIVRIAEMRMAKQLKEFDDTFKKAGRGS
jgi:hypothetical protein